LHVPYTWVFFQAIVHVTGTTPSSLLSRNASHTAADPSTILLRQGGWPACSSSHPFTESHWSTTFAVTVLPFDALILINFPHLEPPLYHPVDNATTFSVLLWNCSSHWEAPPPSPPVKDSLRFVIRVCLSCAILHILKELKVATLHLKRTVIY